MRAAPRASPCRPWCLLAMLSDRADTRLRGALATAFVVAAVPIAFVLYALLT